MTMQLMTSDREWQLAGGPYTQDVAFDMAVSLSQLEYATKVIEASRGSFYVWAY